MVSFSLALGKSVIFSSHLRTHQAMLMKKREREENISGQMPAVQSWRVSVCMSVVGHNKNKDEAMAWGEGGGAETFACLSNFYVYFLFSLLLHLALSVCPVSDKTVNGQFHGVCLYAQQGHIGQALRDA